jgi:hypothetical protein
MYGVFLQGNEYGSLVRPKSKKQIRETVAMAPGLVRLEATSIFGNEYDGSLSDAPIGEYVFVGPDPHTSRVFFGTITIQAGDVIKVK